MCPNVVSICPKHVGFCVHVPNVQRPERAALNHKKQSNIKTIFFNDKKRYKYVTM